MLATGGSVLRAVRVLLDAGVREERIVLVHVVAAPEGVAAVSRAFPRATLIAAEVDERLNEHKYIVPGLGDFGDRYFGTVATARR